jgi:hypothetical protein
MSLNTLTPSNVPGATAAPGQSQFHKPCKDLCLSLQSFQTSMLMTNVLLTLFTEQHTSPNNNFCMICDVYNNKLLMNANQGIRAHLNLYSLFLKKV